MAEQDRNPSTIDELRHRDVHEHEPEVATPSSWRQWSTLLAGPVLWLIHFFVVYLLAEDVCAEVTYGTTGSPISERSMRAIIMVVTIVFALACAGLGAAGLSKIRSGKAHFVTKVGTALLFGGAFGVLLVGGTAVWVGTC